MAKDQKLALLQNWLKTVVMTPGHLPQKLGQARHLYALSEMDVVANEGKASVYTRLNVYSSGYLMRLLDCMYADYPISKKFMGDEVFDSFAKAYLLYHPSTSFTLYDLGKAFPLFLAKTKPQGMVGDDQQLQDFMDLPVALTKLERARQEAIRAPGTEDDTQRDQGINIQDILFNIVKVSVPACLQLLELEFSMIRFFTAVYRGEDYELPSPQKTFLAVSRKNYKVTMTELTETQYILLTVCQTEDNLYDAITTTASLCKVSASILLADVYLWIPLFQKNGLVAWS
ncbi:DNA-binding domain-containing protein [Mucilaginibacter lappiensis]|uniref:DNA-binding domain-containing protein n=1 Tax=Mucilaginibacter lappiensis TaxID=354630 RepID=UPI003D23C9AB